MWACFMGHSVCNCLYMTSSSTADLWENWRCTLHNTYWHQCLSSVTQAASLICSPVHSVASSVNLVFCLRTDLPPLTYASIMFFSKHCLFSWHVLSILCNSCLIIQFLHLPIICFMLSLLNTYQPSKAPHFRWLDLLLILLPSLTTIRCK